VKTIGMAFRFVRRNWLIIIAVIVNIAIGAPLAANWKNDVCYVNNQAVPCCTDCTFFCSCGDSPAP
jgi:hypothetical protein